MTNKTITASEFLKGGAARVRDQRTKHQYTATWVDGAGLVVKDAAGNPVKVSFGATSDNRSVSAHIAGVGFIGGWQYPHKAQAFRKLVDSINQGVLYSDMNCLPKRAS